MKSIEDISENHFRVCQKKTIVYKREHKKSLKKSRLNERTIPLVKRRKKKTLRASEHRVYCTYFPDGRYYIGYSCKPPKQWDKYYGSSREIKEYTTNTPTEQQALKKELIVTYNNKNQAKLQEMLLQLQHRYDDNCINDMIHIRLRLKYLTDFEPIEWEPKSYKSIT